MKIGRKIVMSRRLTVLMILILLLVGLNGAILAQTRDRDLVDPAERWPEVFGGGIDNGGDDFAAKVAGTWLGKGWFALDFGCDGTEDGDRNYFDYDSQSFTASGLYISTNPTNPNLGHGTWKKTGPKEITTNNITYLNVPWPVTVTVPLVDDETGERLPLDELDALTGTGTAGPPLTLNFIARIPGVYTFDRKFETATSDFGAILYIPGTDPLDPDNEPVLCTVGRHEVMKKVTVD